jgi:ribosomal protein S18 acetylase RimI-like enzyme
MAHAETLARDHGVTEVRLVTNGAFVRNIALYKRLGYRVDSETPFLNGTAVYMSKKLVAADA